MIFSQSVCRGYVPISPGYIIYSKTNTPLSQEQTTRPRPCRTDRKAVSPQRTFVHNKASLLPVTRSRYLRDTQVGNVAPLSVRKPQNCKVNYHNTRDVAPFLYAPLLLFISETFQSNKAQFITAIICICSMCAAVFR